MISIDTNILFYSLNRDCPEHDRARRFVTECTERADIAISELVLLELYVLLRNPAIVSQPLDAADAVAACRPFRTHPHWALIENAPIMSRVWTVAANADQPRRAVFDARIGYTLLHHGVQQLATRNVKDFKGLGFERVFDPLVDDLNS